MASQYVGMVQFFEDVDFREEQLLQFFALEAVELDYLDRDRLPCVGIALLVTSWWAL